MQKIVNVTKLNEDLGSIASAIQVLDGSVGELEFPIDYVNKIQQFYTKEDFVNLSKPVGELYSEATTCPGWAYCLYNRSGITGLNFPNATTIAKQYFWNCTGLANINAPKARFIGESGLRNCNAAQYIVLESCWWVGNYGIVSTNLLGIDMGKEPYSGNNEKGLATYAFYGCSKLNTIILRHDQCINLLATSGLGNTPFASGKAGGTLYVPQDLIASYQNNTNWAAILAYQKNGSPQNQILPIEESYYATHYVDGSVIPNGD